MSFIAWDIFWLSSYKLNSTSKPSLITKWCIDFEFKFSAVIFTKTQTSVSFETTFSISRLNPGQTLSNFVRTFYKKDWNPMYVPDKEWLPFIVILHSGWYHFESDSMSPSAKFL